VAAGSNPRQSACVCPLKGRAIAYAAETPIGKIDHGGTESTEK
jgi:hypothetical protein